MARLWALLLAALALAGGAVAGDAVEATAKPSGLAELIAGLQARYDTTTDFTARVEQEMTVASLGRTLELTGTVSFKRPGLMRWELQGHNREIIVADGETIWVYHPDDEQAFKASFDKAFRSTTPISFLTGIGRIEEDFEISDGGTTDSLAYLKLQPRKGEELGRLRLGIDPATYDVREARIEDPLGNTTVLRFSDIARDVGLKDEVFRFEVPRGTEVMEVPRGFAQ